MEEVKRLRIASLLLMVMITILCLLTSPCAAQESGATGDCGSGSGGGGLSIPGEFVQGASLAPVITGSEEVVKPDSGTNCYSFTATGGYPPYTWQVASGTGVTIDESTGNACVTSSACGGFTVSATDQRGSTVGMSARVGNAGHWKFIEQQGCTNCNEGGAGWSDCTSGDTWIHYKWIYPDDCPLCTPQKCPCPGGPCPTPDDPDPYKRRKVFRIDIYHWVCPGQ